MCILFLFLLFLSFKRSGIGPFWSNAFALQLFMVLASFVVLWLSFLRFGFLCFCFVGFGNLGFVSLGIVSLFLFSLSFFLLLLFLFL